MALTIAGSDSAGGAGVVADVRTFAAHGVWPAVALTAVTVQTTLGVAAIEPVSPSVIGAQIDAVVEDLRPQAVKIGMLGTAAAVAAVAAAVQSSIGVVVVDPVLRATAGGVLLADDAVDALARQLLPLAALVTPNLAEAAVLAELPEADVGTRDGMVDAARRILRTGVGAVLVTGGHLDEHEAADCLVVPGDPPVWLVGERIDGPGSHGSGCVLSAAVAARLARGEQLPDACAGAKRYVEAAIRAAVTIGRGQAAVVPPAEAM